MFIGSSALLKKPGTQQEQKEQEMIKIIAEIFDLPANAVNVMGGMPYINKDGLGIKVEYYEPNKVKSLTVEHLQLSTKPGERAIAQATMTMKDGRVLQAIGEADDKSVKLEMVKQTPNMMAETRAKNRVKRELIGSRMLVDLMTKIGNRKMGNQKMSEAEKELAARAVSSSAEEMIGAPKENVDFQVINQQHQAPVNSKANWYVEIANLLIEKEVKNPVALYKQLGITHLVSPVMNQSDYFNARAKLMQYFNGK